MAKSRKTSKSTRRHGPVKKTSAKKTSAQKASTKRAVMKKRASRDIVTTPTVEQIERSISFGQSATLSEFVKGIKW
jgi:hypothetical protein